MDTLILIFIGLTHACHFLFVGKVVRGSGKVVGGGVVWWWGEGVLLRFHLLTLSLLIFNFSEQH